MHLSYCSTKGPGLARGAGWVLGAANSQNPMQVGSQPTHNTLPSAYKLLRKPQALEKSWHLFDGLTLGKCSWVFMPSSLGRGA